MHPRTAGFLFLAICIILAILLLTDSITPMTSGCVFAVALVIPGGLSRGFKKNLKINPSSIEKKVKRKKEKKGKTS